MAAGPVGLSLGVVPTRKGIIAAVLWKPRVHLDGKQGPGRREGVPHRRGAAEGVAGGDSPDRRTSESIVRITKSVSTWEGSGRTIAMLKASVETLSKRGWFFFSDLLRCYI